MTDKELEEMLDKKLRPIRDAISNPDPGNPGLAQQVFGLGQGVVHIATTLRHSAIDDNARVCMAKMVETFVAVQPDVEIDDGVAARIAADSYRIARAMAKQSQMDHLRSAVDAVNGDQAKA